jgi:hypothetical protein
MQFSMIPEDVECNRFGSVAELRCLLERKLHLSPLQAAIMVHAATFRVERWQHEI